MATGKQRGARKEIVRNKKTQRRTVKSYKSVIKG